MKNLEDKFPRITIHKISNGFLVAIHPENNDMQKLLGNYIKQFMDTIQNADGEDWKNKMQTQIDNAMKMDGNDSIKLIACKDEYEVMSIIAPKEDIATDKPDLRWFWSEKGHIPA